MSLFFYNLIPVLMQNGMFQQKYVTGKSGIL